MYCSAHKRPRAEVADKNVMLYPCSEQREADQAIEMWQESGYNRVREKVRAVLWRLQEEQLKSHRWVYRNSSGWTAREDAIHNLASANAVQRPEGLAEVLDVYQKGAWIPSEHNCGTPAGHQQEQKGNVWKIHVC